MDLAGTLLGVKKADQKAVHIDPNAYKLNAGLAQNRDAAGNILTQAGQRVGPTADAAQLATGQADSTAAQQGQLGQMLMAQAQGHGPSMAQAQLGQGIGASLAAQNAALASGRGGNAGTNARDAAQAAADTQQQAAMGSANLKVQEQQAAQGQLGSLLGTQRQQDIGQAQTQAQMQQQTNLANQAAALQQQGLNDTQIRAMLGDQISVGNTEQQAGENYQQARANQTNIENAAAAQQQEAANKGFSSLIGSVGSAMPGIGSLLKVGGATSDENAKENIHPADAQIGQFLDKVHAHAFSYKDPEADGAGQHVGPMAQELEKSQIGRQLVHEDQDGVKKVDYQQGLGAMLAGLAHLHGRMKKLEAA
jgi:hypothetical protein